MNPLPVALVQDAAASLRAGNVVAIPTDTVYGLAVDPSRPGATAALYAMKGRPAEVAVPILVADFDQAEELVSPRGFDGRARGLAATFWPGPLTLVVRRRPGILWDLGGDPRTIGLRCPAPRGPELCRLVGPLATTSANRHGEPPLTTVADVRATFGETVDAVLDGGVCAGTPSTVVDLTASTTRCLREAALSFADVLRVADRSADG